MSVDCSADAASGQINKSFHPNKCIVVFPAWVLFMHFRPCKEQQNYVDHMAFTNVSKVFCLKIIIFITYRIF